MSLIDMSKVHTWIKKSWNLPLAFSNSSKELIQTFNDLKTHYLTMSPKKTFQVSQE